MMLGFHSHAPRQSAATSTCRQSRPITNRDPINSLGNGLLEISQHHSWYRGDVFFAKSNILVALKSCQPGGTIIVLISPQSPVLVFPLPGASAGFGRVVGVQLASFHHVLTQRGLPAA